MKEEYDWRRFWKGLVASTIIEIILFVLMFLIVAIILSLSVKAYSINYNYFYIVDADTELPLNNSLVTNLDTQNYIISNETGFVFIEVPEHKAYTYRIETEGYQTIYHSQMATFWHHPLDNNTYEWEIPNTYLSPEETVFSTPISDLIVKFIIGFSIIGVFLVPIFIFLLVTNIKK